MTIKVFASGQSNMLGRGIGGPALIGVSSNVRVWNNVNPLGSNGSAFVTASSAQAAGTFELTDRNNLAVWFCDSLARKQLDTVDLTVVARASSQIALWSPTETTYPMLQECIDVYAATGQGPADVFIWHQGENNSTSVHSTYRALFEALVANLIAGNVIKSDATIITGGLLEDMATKVQFNSGALVPLSFPVRRGHAASAGLTSPDAAHFDGHSLYKMGASRYYSAYLFAKNRPA